MVNGSCPVFLVFLFPFLTIQRPTHKGAHSRFRQKSKYSKENQTQRPLLRLWLYQLINHIINNKIKCVFKEFAQFQICVELSNVVIAVVPLAPLNYWARLGRGSLAFSKIHDLLKNQLLLFCCCSCSFARNYAGEG